VVDRVESMWLMVISRAMSLGNLISWMAKVGLG